MKIRCNEVGDIKPWHRWFAWHPVYLGPHDMRWLEFVWRKGTYVASWYETFWEWEYSSTTYE